MRNILLALFIGIFVTVFGIFTEKCFFDHENCPIRWANAEKYKGPDTNLIRDQSKRSASALNALDFKINYVYRPNGKGEFKDFGKGSVLHSGDHYKLMFEPSDNGYVYIFQIDSSNSIFRLFPTVDFKGADPKNVNAVIKGRKYFVPAEHWSFRLDKTIGKETIYFVVTRQPDANLEKHYKTMLAQQKMRRIENRLTARQAWDSAMKLRGPEIDLMKDVTEPEPARVWQEGGKTFSADQRTYLKDMCDGCVYIVDFEHR
jgi:hypothetical protein